jgi:predicted TIM-barrel fold metal-dependent hydrolase
VLSSARLVQFHTGLGDNDLLLTQASPSLLQPLIRAYPSTPVVLLHGAYPFTREAGYLAATYANVYLDIGEVWPFISASGQRDVVRQSLELCPSSKVLWSSTSHHLNLLTTAS